MSEVQIQIQEVESVDQKINSIIQSIKESVDKNDALIAGVIRINGNNCVIVHGNSSIPDLLEALDTFMNTIQENMSVIFNKGEQDAESR